MWVVFCVQAVFAIVAVVLLLRIYASWKLVPWYAYVVTALGWFMAATPMFLVPADIAQAIDLARGYVTADDNIDKWILTYIWKADYWIMFFLTWVFCPFLQDFVDSGGFTFGQKFKAALIINGIFYGSALLVVVGFVIYLAVAQNFGKDEFLSLASSLGNAVGLCLLLLLLGFGLVDVPRTLWRRANYQLMQRMYQFDATMLAERVDEAKEEHAAAMEEVRQARAEVPFHSALRRHVDTIIAKCSSADLDPPSSTQQATDSTQPGHKPGVLRNKSIFSFLRIGMNKDSSDSNADDDGDEETGHAAAAAAGGGGASGSGGAATKENAVARDIRSKYGLARKDAPKTGSAADGSATDEEYGGSFDERKLIALHSRVMQAEAAIRREQLFWDELCHSYIKLEDAINAARDPSHRFRSSLHPPRTGRFAAQQEALEWWWRVWLRPICLRMNAVFLALFSLGIVWSEVMVVFFTPDMSLFSLLINYSGWPGWLLQLVILAPIVYMLAAAMTALFGLRVWKIFALFRHGQSPPSSLLFSAAYISRVAAPVAFNVLNMSRLTLFPVTAFQQALGDFNVVRALGSYFPMYAPACLVLLCLLTMCNMGSRIMNLLSSCLGRCKPCARLKTFVFEEGYDDQRIDRGRTLLADARKRYAGRYARDIGMASLVRDTDTSTGDDDDTSYGISSRPRAPSLPGLTTTKPATAKPAASAASDYRPSAAAVGTTTPTRGSGGAASIAPSPSRAAAYPSSNRLSTVSPAVGRGAGAFSGGSGGDTSGTDSEVAGAVVRNLFRRPAIPTTPAKW